MLAVSGAREEDEEQVDDGEEGQAEVGDVDEGQEPGGSAVHLPLVAVDHVVDVDGFVEVEQRGEEVAAEVGGDGQHERPGHPPLLGNEVAR